MPESPTVIVESPCLRVATWRELFFEIWFEPGKMPDLNAHHAAQRAFAQRLGGEQMIAFSVIHARAMVTLDRDVRRAVEEGTREMQAHVKASAVVIAANGFTAAAIRSLIAALMLLNRPKYPTRVFDQEDAACDWAAGHLAPALGGLATAEALRAAYRRIRHPPGGEVVPAKRSTPPTRP